MGVRLKVAFAAVLLSTTAVSGQQALRSGAAVNAAAKGATLAAPQVHSAINGIVIDTSRRPLRNVRARLRNLTTNTVEQTVAVDERGRFGFATGPEVPYVIEITDRAGRILAVGDVIVLNPGEVAGVVIAPSFLPALSGIFGETASSVIATAAGLGLTVVDPALPKVSPSR